MLQRLCQPSRKRAQNQVLPFTLHCWPCCSLLHCHVMHSHVLHCAFLRAKCQLCAIGYVLADFCAEVPSVPPVTTPSNCPTEANISTCSQEQSGGPRCPDSACDMLCALWGASNLSVTGYRAYSSSSSNSARKVSAGKTTVISISTLGEGFALRHLVKCASAKAKVVAHLYRGTCTLPPIQHPPLLSLVLYCRTP